MPSPERTAARVALAGIAASGVLALLKTTVGLAAHSVATVSDGVESAADVISSGLVYLGLRIAAKPADEDHPYGHGRFETLIALAVGVLLFTMTKVTHSEYVDVAFTVFVRYALMFGMNLFLLGALLLHDRSRQYCYARFYQTDF